VKEATMNECSIDRRSLLTGAGALVISIGIPCGFAEAEIGTLGSAAAAHLTLILQRLVGIRASSNHGFPPPRIVNSAVRRKASASAE